MSSVHRLDVGQYASGIIECLVQRPTCFKQRSNRSGNSNILLEIPVNCHKFTKVLSQQRSHSSM
uniref:Uncharacterized protein n=1 Tax=Octopus bimaculoides TaxID=37653 RepID=A0A0L8HXD4_OCTBM